MTDRDLRKMVRKELLELLLASERENEQFKERQQNANIERQLYTGICANCNSAWIAGKHTKFPVK